MNGSFVCIDEECGKKMPIFFLLLLLFLQFMLMSVLLFLLEQITKRRSSLSFSLSYFLVDRKEEKKTDSINS
jgi:hypothetical protein